MIGRFGFVSWDAPEGCSMGGLETAQDRTREDVQNMFCRVDVHEEGLWHVRPDWARRPMAHIWTSCSLAHEFPEMFAGSRHAVRLD